MKYLEKIYGKDSKNNIEIIFFYIDKNDEVYSIKNTIEEIKNGELSEERQLNIIKENQFNIDKKHKLIACSYLNINIKEQELEKFIEKDIDTSNNYFTNLNLIGTIKLNESLKIFENINTVIYIYKVLVNSNNTTKKINLNSTKNLTKNSNTDTNINTNTTNNKNKNKNRQTRRNNNYKFTLDKE
jgi:hypothetical protein